MNLDESTTVFYVAEVYFVNATPIELRKAILTIIEKLSSKRLKLFLIS